MKFEYDKDVDAAYIYVESPLGESGSNRRIELNQNIILDFDKKGKLLGIEILDASKILNKKVLTEAKAIAA